MAAPDSRVPRIRVSAILVLSGRLVLVRHRKEAREYYLLPGGGLRYGETLADALVREVFEETGLGCRPVSLALVNDSISPDGFRHVVNLTFLADSTDIDPRVSAPHDERIAGIELVEPAQLPNLDLRPPIAHEVISVLHSETPPASRYIGSVWSPERPGDTV